MREFPDIFEDIAKRTRENAQALVRDQSEFEKAIRESVKAFSDSIRREAQSFLGNGPQDGLSVAARAAQRRATRARRRFNRNQINSAFESTGFSSLQGGRSIGAFGAQNVDVSNLRAQAVPTIPGLEEALQNLIRDDGTTLLEQQRESLLRFSEEAEVKRQELLAVQEEIAAEQEKANRDQVDLLDKFVEVALKSRDAISDLQKNIERLDVKIESVNSDIDRFSRARARRRL